MSIFIDDTTRLVVQGITGRDGSFHARQMMDYGTQVVAGVTPGKGGQTFDEQVPVFNTVAEAVAETGANASVVYVPAAFAADAVLEAADAGIDLIVCITEGVPVQDAMRALPYVREKGARLVGPNCPGLIAPGVCKVGILPGQIVQPGPVGVVSRSGTLTYEVIFQLTRAGIGQSTCVGIGGDRSSERTSWTACRRSRRIRRPGPCVCSARSEARTNRSRPSSSGPHDEARGRLHRGTDRTPGRRMGHAGAIISGSEGTAEEKMRAFRECGIAVAERPADFVGLVPNDSDRSEGDIPDVTDTSRRAGGSPARLDTSMGGRQRMQQTTLAIVKPDAFGSGKAGRILAHLENEGFEILAARVARLRGRGASVLRRSRERPFYGLWCVHDIRALHARRAAPGGRGGPSAPRDRSHGSGRSGGGYGRALFAESKERNAIHASDSVENAAARWRSSFRYRADLSPERADVGHVR